MCSSWCTMEKSASVGCHTGAGRGAACRRAASSPTLSQVVSWMYTPAPGRRVGVEPRRERTRGEAPELPVEPERPPPRRAARERGVVGQPEGVRVQRSGSSRAGARGRPGPWREPGPTHAARPRARERLGRRPTRSRCPRRARGRGTREPVLGAAEDGRLRRQPRPERHREAQKHQRRRARLRLRQRVEPRAHPLPHGPRAGVTSRASQPMSRASPAREAPCPAPSTRVIVGTVKAIMPHA
jgi:hypothetical protein